MSTHIWGNIIFPQVCSETWCPLGCSARAQYHVQFSRPSCIHRPPFVAAPKCPTQCPRGIPVAYLPSEFGQLKAMYSYRAMGDHCGHVVNTCPVVETWAQHLLSQMWGGMNLAQRFKAIFCSQFYSLVKPEHSLKNNGILLLDSVLLQQDTTLGGS